MTKVTPDIPDPADDEPLKKNDGTHDFGRPFARHSLPRFLIRHAVIGKTVGLLLTGLLILLDVGGLGELIRTSEDGPLAAFILAIAMMGLMGGLSMATGVYLFYASESEDSSDSSP